MCLMMAARGLSGPVDGSPVCLPTRLHGHTLPVISLRTAIVFDKARYICVLWGRGFERRPKGRDGIVSVRHFQILAYCGWFLVTTSPGFEICPSAAFVQQ